MSQKDVFLEGEGDAWFARNPATAAGREPGTDPVLAAMLELPVAAGMRVLEIGCGEGARLEWLTANRQCEAHGVEPSARAVDAARARGVRAQRGTADSLPFENAYFDVVIFGFCLYLCDRGDLFRIAAEADRVLRSPGWLVIHDFYAEQPTRHAYHHRPGVFSYKMDYRTLFDWHPAYGCYSQRVAHHAGGGFTDEQSEWVALSVLRKT